MQLGKLHVRLSLTAEDVGLKVEEQVQRRCTAADLSDALDRSPVCAACRLRLDEEPDFTPVEALLAQTHQAVVGYVAAIGDEETRQRIRQYSAALPRRGDLTTRLNAIADLGPDPTAREILSLFTEDAILHLNRVISGKSLIPRNFGELREALRGRTLTKAEAQELFQNWIAGHNGGGEGDDLLQIDE